MKQKRSMLFYHRIIIAVDSLIGGELSNQSDQTSEARS